MTEPDSAPTDETVSSPCIERRAFVRLASELVTSCRPSDSAREVSWPGKVRDMSLGGIGLVLQHRFRPGTTLDVELRDAAGKPIGVVQARVVHATAIREEERSCWLLGCSFHGPLTEEEFESLR